MPLARINNLILNFVHIPKTGGSCISSYLRAKGPLAFYSPVRPDWLPSSPQHLTSQYQNALVPPSFTDLSFAVIRDPVERLMSEFRYRVRRASARGTNCTRAEDGRYLVEVEQIGNLRFTFEEWLDATFDGYRHDPASADNHIRPQCDFIDANTVLFRFEDGLSRVIDWIDAVTNTGPIQTQLDYNASHGPDVMIPEETRRKIEVFYDVDYAILERLKVSRTDKVVPCNSYT